jgi:hypothetical protein
VSHPSNNSKTAGTTKHRPSQMYFYNTHQRHSRGSRHEIRLAVFLSHHNFVREKRLHAQRNQDPMPSARQMECKRRRDELDE